MGYTVTIGEAIIDTDIFSMIANRYSHVHTLISVDRIDGKDIGAPIDSTGDNTHLNQIDPSYDNWETFCFRNGLGPLQIHMTTVLYIQEQHISAIAIALDAHKVRDCKTFVDEVDYTQVRLEWLLWWSRWSLSNCKNPVITVR